MTSIVTFDRVRVTDDDIQLALTHAQNKFGNNLTLTGDDPIFTARMARLADDMGIGILNPELQVVIANHRESKKLDIIEALTVVPVAQIDHVTKSKKNAAQVMPPTGMQPEPAQQIKKQKQKQESESVLVKTPVQTRGEQPVKQPFKETQSKAIQPKPAQPVPPAVTPPEVTQVVQEPIQTPQERLRAMVLSIDPHATFETADPENSAKQYFGPVAASLDDQANPRFAQRTARGVYTLHATNAPAEHNDASIEIQYRNGEAKVKMPNQGQGKSR